MTTAAYGFVLVFLAARVGHRLYCLISESAAKKVCNMLNGVSPSDYRLFCVCDLAMLVSTVALLIGGWQGY